jgi:hypothetical protein
MSSPVDLCFKLEHRPSGDWNVRWLSAARRHVTRWPGPLEMLDKLNPCATLEAQDVSPNLGCLAKRPVNIQRGILAMLRTPAADANQSRLGFQAQRAIDRVCTQLRLAYMRKKLETTAKLHQCGGIVVESMTCVGAAREIHDGDSRVIAPVHSCSHLAAAPESPAADASFLFILTTPPHKQKRPLGSGRFA